MIVVVADDDRRARFVLKSMLLDADESSMVLEAKDGQELMEQCLRHHPALALVDIHMPKLDGISAIERCQKESPLTQFAIISGYRDFDDARRCIAMNITDYLLKPIDEIQLRDLVQRMTCRVVDGYRQENMRFAVRMMRLFHLLDEVGQAEDDPIPGIIYQGFIFCVEGNGQQVAKTNQELLHQINQLGEKLVRTNTQYACVYSKRGFLRTVFATRETDKQTLLNDEIQRIVSRGRSCTALTATADEPDKLYLLCEQMEKQQAARWVFPQDQLLMEADFQRVWPLYGAFLTDMRRLADSCFTLDETAYAQQLAMIRKQYDDYPDGFPNTLFAQRFGQAMDRTLEGGTFNGLLKSLEKQTQAMFQSADPPPQRDRMEEIKRYIDSHFTQDIGINSIAEQFGLTPNYLSTLFRERYRCRFVEYITALRIGKAKQMLLLSKDVSIKDVALMVGYYDARYFSNVFAKATGLQPSEFRNGQS